jgi:hypothetical protein
MERWFTTAKLTTLALFFILSLGTVAYEAIFIWPVQRCEQSGAWWDPRDRQCLTPIPIERFTRRAMSALPGFKPVSDSPPEPTTRPPAPAH